jgi:Integrase core domain
VADQGQVRLRDRDSVYGQTFRQRVKGMGIQEVLTAPRSPWQNPFAERLVGSIRHECLDHVLVLSERHLRRILACYLAYYHRARTHLALDKDAPDGRPVEPSEAGNIVEIPEVGGLHHRYIRLGCVGPGLSAVPASNPRKTLPLRSPHERTPTHWAVRPSMREGLGSSNATTTEHLVWWLRSARRLIGESDDVLAKDRAIIELRFSLDQT